MSTAQRIKDAEVQRRAAAMRLREQAERLAPLLRLGRETNADLLHKAEQMIASRPGGQTEREFVDQCFSDYQKPSKPQARELPRFPSDISTASSLGRILVALHARNAERITPLSADDLRTTAERILASAPACLSEKEFVDSQVSIIKIERRFDGH